jgi:hypothetical protein
MAGVFFISFLSQRSVDTDSIGRQAERKEKYRVFREATNHGEYSRKQSE